MILVITRLITRFKYQGDVMSVTTEQIRNDAEVAASLHRLIWGWVAENPGKEKYDWPAWRSNGGDVGNVQNHCFCCEHDLGQGGGLCEFCPVVWPSGHGECEGGDGDGLFSQFLSAFVVKKDFDLACKIAAQIRDLPVRELPDA